MNLAFSLIELVCRSKLVLRVSFKICIYFCFIACFECLAREGLFSFLFSMKAILLLAAALTVLGTCGVAVAGSATQEAMDEEVATSRALSKVPQGKKVTGTSCTSIEIGMGGETSYRCTATWD